MRGTMLVCLAVVLLVVAILVMKNLGGGEAGRVDDTHSKQYIDRAQGAAEAVNSRIEDISRRANAD